MERLKKSCSSSYLSSSSIKAADFEDENEDDYEHDSERTRIPIPKRCGADASRRTSKSYLLGYGISGVLALQTRTIQFRAMRKLFSWFRSHPIVSILCILTAFFVAAHFFLNWQAERRWQNYAEAARARGVKLTLSEFDSPEIPDAENFAALPMFRAIMNGGVQRPMELPAVDGFYPPDFGNRLKDEPLDWQKWQMFFKNAGYIAETTSSPPGDVLRALNHYSPQFAEWSEWKDRPRCRFPLDGNTGINAGLIQNMGISVEQPPLGMFQDAAKLFSLRMRAHLALGDSLAACSDFCDEFQAVRALNEQPTFLAALVEFSILNGLCENVGDGLMAHAWADAELTKIEKDLSTVALIRRYRAALESDRAEYNRMYDRYTSATPMGRWRLHTAPLAGRPTPPIMDAIKFTPRRFFRDNQLRHNQWTDELLARFDAEATRFDPDGATPSGPRNWDTWFDAYYYLLFRVTALSSDGHDSRCLRTLIKLDQTRIAVALERFRLARGNLPESLAELVPDFITALPRDIFTGEPMIYRRKETGGFLLYSFGPDRHDDGGAIDPKKSEVRQPDWVWLYSRD